MLEVSAELLTSGDLPDTSSRDHGTGLGSHIMYSVIKVVAIAVLATVSTITNAAGRLVVENAWIRAAPPGVGMLAGYATLRNDGDAPLVVIGAETDDFGSASLHQTITRNGVEHMQSLGEVTLEPGQSLQLAPGGGHLMLMGPKRELHDGDVVEMHVLTQAAGTVSARFVVRADAPQP